MLKTISYELSAQTIQVSTYAGSNAGFTDGDALTQAKFLFPSGVGVCVGPDGNVYVADQGNHAIRKITPDGQVTTIAGNGEQGFVDGQGTSARFISPSGLDFDASGNIYVADQNNHAIRKISTTGFVSTLAGTGSAGSEDGPALSATFLSPVGVAVDDTGNVYVVSLGNQNIRKISISGFVSTLAGHPTTNGHQDGTASTALFYRSSGIAIDNSGNIYVSEEGNHDIRKITPSLMVSTIAGTGHFVAGPGSGGFADGDALTVAQFNTPDGIMVNSSGDIFVADACNQRIRKISNGFVSTLAGTGPIGCGYGGFADGDLSVALFNNPMSVCHNDAGDLFVADQGNNRVRKISNTTSELHFNFGEASQFALLAEQSIISTDNIFISGSAGANGSISSTILTNIGSVLDSQNTLVSSALLMITQLKSDMNNFVGQEIGNDLNGLTLPPGVYHILSNANFSGISTLNGDTTSKFLFNIDGDLKVQEDFILKLGVVKPENIVWDVLGTVTLPSSIHFSGLVLAGGDIISTFGNTGKVSLFTDTDIKLKEGDLTKINTPFYSINVLNSIPSISVSTHPLQPCLSPPACNQVCNGGFEWGTTNGCVLGTAHFDETPGWDVIDDALGTPDLFNSCCSTFCAPAKDVWCDDATLGISNVCYVDVPDNRVGSQNAHGGNNYAGLFTYILPNTISGENEQREYLQTLISPLNANTVYFVSAFASLAEQSIYATNNLSFFLTQDLLLGNQTWAPIPVVGSIIRGPYIDDTRNWVPICGFHTAVGDEDVLAIGNFDDDAATTIVTRSIAATSETYNGAYYYIDDVSIVPVFDRREFAGQDINICPAQTGTIGTPLLCNDPNITFNWSPSTGLASPTSALTTVSASVTTTYTLTSTMIQSGGTVCQISDDVTVFVSTVPTVPDFTLCLDRREFAGQDINICPGENATIGSILSCTNTNVSFHWSPSTGIINPYLSVITVSPTVTTNYTLTVTITLNGEPTCEITDDVTVKVESAGPDVTICKYSNVQLLASCTENGDLIKWSPPNSDFDNPFIANPVVTPPNPTNNYTVTITKPNGNIITDEITVNTEECESISSLNIVFKNETTVPPCNTLPFSNSFSSTITPDIPDDGTKILVDVYTLDTRFANIHNGPILQDGQKYELTVKGSYRQSNYTTDDYAFDAAYQFFTDDTQIDNFNNFVQDPYKNFKPEDDTYKSSHEYTYCIIGQGLPFNIEFLDIGGYADNIGFLEYELYAVHTPFIFDWYFNDDNTHSNLNNSVHSYINSGTFDVTVKATNQQCISSAYFPKFEGSFDIILYKPLQFSASITNDDCINNNDIGSITNVSGGTQPFSYQWSGGNYSTSESPDNLFLLPTSVNITDIRGCGLTVPATLINLYEPLTFSANITDDVCSSQNDGKGTITNESGGIQPFTYEWKSGNFTSSEKNPENLASGKYYVKITDDIGCQSTVLATLTTLYQPGKFSASFTDIGGCSNKGIGTITNESGGTPPFTYYWFSIYNSTPLDPQHLSSGTYNVIITDSKGCQSTIITTNFIAQYEPLIFSASIISNNDCSTRYNGIGNIVIESGGTYPYTYEWKMNGNIISNSSIPHNLRNGTYSVKVSDAKFCNPVISVSYYSGCPYDPNNKVLISPRTKGKCNIVLSTDTLFYAINFQNIGTAPAQNVIILDTIDIINLDKNTFKIIESSHPYQFTLGQNGLLSIQYQNINLPDSSTDFFGSMGFIAYKIVPRTDVVPGTIIRDQAGIYFDQQPPVITNPTINTILGTAIAIVSSENTNFCSGDLVKLSATGSERFLWSTGDTSSFITTSQQGYYFVTDPDFCFAGSDTIYLKENSLPVVTLGEDKLIYLGYSPENLNLTVVSADHIISYIWNTGETTPSITVSPTITSSYNVSVTDQNVCKNSDAVIVNVQDIRCGKKMDKVLVCHLPPGKKSKPELICIDRSAVPAHLAHGDLLGLCSPSRFANVQASDDNTNPEIEIDVFPNPFYGGLNISLKNNNNSGLVGIDLCNSFGKIIDRLYLNDTDEDQYINIDYNNMDLKEGIYFLKVNSPYFNVIKKIIYFK